MNCPYCIKICGGCGELLVAYNGNFGKQKGGKYGFKSRCKRCLNIESKEWRENNKEHIKEYQKEYYENNKEKLKEYRENNKEHISEKRKERYEKNKNKEKKQSKEYYENNKEYKKEKSKEYYENNKEYYKEWRENNKEHIKEKNKEWRENNPEKIFNNAQKRRHKLENQGRGISKDQWYEMMEFFNWKCAYSGIQLDKSNRSIDHIISLNENGLNEPWNCVPMYKNYNTSKHTNDMVAWYKQQPFYSEERLNKIYKWIEYAKNKWENSNK